MAKDVKSKLTESRQLNETGEVVAFTVRLNPEQARLIGQAAGIRGWSPTAFMKGAAIERAANVVNCRTPRNLPLRETVERIADMLCKAPQVFLVKEDTREQFFGSEDLDPEPPSGLDYGSSFRPLTGEDVRSLDQLAHFGGSEFLRMLVDRCRVVSKADLGGSDPQPVDPTQLLGSKEGD